MVYEHGRAIIKVPDGPIIPELCYMAIVAKGGDIIYFFGFFVIYI